MWFQDTKTGTIGSQKPSKSQARSPSVHRNLEIPALPALQFTEAPDISAFCSRVTKTPASSALWFTKFLQIPIYKFYQVQVLWLKNPMMLQLRLQKNVAGVFWANPYNCNYINNSHGDCLGNVSGAYGIVACT